MRVDSNWCLSTSLSPRTPDNDHDGDQWSSIINDHDSDYDNDGEFDDDAYWWLMVIIGDREEPNWYLSTSLPLHSPENHIEDGYHDGDHDSDEYFDGVDYDDRDVNGDNNCWWDGTLTIKANSSSQGSCLLWTTNPSRPVVSLYLKF